MSNRTDFRDRTIDVFVAARRLRLANINGQNIALAYVRLVKALDDAEEALARIGEPEEGYVGAIHPETSRKAAKRVAPKRGSIRSIIHHRLGDLGDHGATDHELHRWVQDHFGYLAVDIRTIGSARISLRDDYKFIKDSGLRRPTPSGAEAIVWVLTDLGAEEWDRQERGV